MRPYFLQGHSRPLTQVAFNRDGDLLFTAGKDAKLSCWHVTPKEVKRIGTYNVGKGVVWAFDVSHDSDTIVSASADQKVYIFDVQSGELLHSIDMAGPVRFVEWNKRPGGQISFAIARDGFGTRSNPAIEIYKFDDENEEWAILKSFDDYQGRCTQVRWCDFDRAIVSAHETGHLYVWDIETGEPRFEERVHSKGITNIAFDRDRMLMLTVSTDATAKLWQMPDMELLAEYQVDRPLNACDISPLITKDLPERRLHILLGGGQAAEDVTTTGASEGKFEAMLYHMTYKTCLGSIKGHFGPINTMGFMPDGKGFVSGGEDGYVRVYFFDEDYTDDAKCKFDR